MRSAASRACFSVRVLADAVEATTMKRHRERNRVRTFMAVFWEPRSRRGVAVFFRENVGRPNADLRFFRCLSDYHEPSVFLSAFHLAGCER